MPPKATDGTAAPAQAEQQAVQQAAQQPKAAAADAGGAAGSKAAPAPRPARPAAPEPTMGIQRSRILLSCAMYVMAVAVLCQKVRLNG